jgi:hypothetical protein
VSFDNGDLTKPLKSSNVNNSHLRQSSYEYYDNTSTGLLSDNNPYSGNDHRTRSGFKSPMNYYKDEDEDDDEDDDDDQEHERDDEQEEEVLRRRNYDDDEHTNTNDIENYVDEHYMNDREVGILKPSAASTVHASSRLRPKLIGRGNEQLANDQYLVNEISSERKNTNVDDIATKKNISGTASSLGSARFKSYGIASAAAVVAGGPKFIKADNGLVYTPLVGQSSFSIGTAKRQKGNETLEPQKRNDQNENINNNYELNELENDDEIERNTDDGDEENYNDEEKRLYGQNDYEGIDFKSSKVYASQQRPTLAAGKPIPTNYSQIAGTGASYAASASTYSNVKKITQLPKINQPNVTGNGSNSFQNELALKLRSMSNNKEAAENQIASNKQPIAMTANGTHLLACNSNTNTLNKKKHSQQQQQQVTSQYLAQPETSTTNTTTTTSASCGTTTSISSASSCASNSDLVIKPTTATTPATATMIASSTPANKRPMLNNDTYSSSSTVTNGSANTNTNSTIKNYSLLKTTINKNGIAPVATIADDEDDVSAHYTIPSGVIQNSYPAHNPSAIQNGTLSRCSTKANGNSNNSSTPNDTQGNSVYSRVNQNGQNGPISNYKPPILKPKPRTNNIYGSATPTVSSSKRPNLSVNESIHNQSTEPLLHNKEISLHTSPSTSVTDISSPNCTPQHYNGAMPTTEVSNGLHNQQQQKQTPSSTRQPPFSSLLSRPQQQPPSLPLSTITNGNNNGAQSSTTSTPSSLSASSSLSSSNNSSTSGDKLAFFLFLVN